MPIQIARLMLRSILEDAMSMLDLLLSGALRLRHVRDLGVREYLRTEFWFYFNFLVLALGGRDCI